MLASFWQSLLFIVSLSSVSAALETDPSPYPGDSVDDIAVWVDPTDPSRSLILATLKASHQMPRKPLGILVYDLDGQQLQFLEGGSPNNIDIRYGYSYEGKEMPIIAVSHWYSGDVSLLTIDAEQHLLVELTKTKIKSGAKKLRGICMHEDTDGNFYYFTIHSSGAINQFRIESKNGWSARKVRQLEVGSNAEGCVVDDYHRKLYVSEEKEGIWKFDADVRGTHAEQVVALGWRDPLKSDLEGITIYDGGNGDGYLIVSSQGNSRYAIYDRRNNQFIDVFEIKDSMDIDGTSYSDGIEAISSNMGPTFPLGFFVAHDNSNVTVEGEMQNQNFKIVDWRQIKNLLERAETH